MASPVHAHTVVGAPGTPIAGFWAVAGIAAKARLAKALASVANTLSGTSAVAGTCHLQAAGVPRPTLVAMTVSTVAVTMTTALEVLNTQGTLDGQAAVLAVVSFVAVAPSMATLPLPFAVIEALLVLE